ncbi:MAG: hypothetical protein U0K95_01685 [Eubacterium sp.]|nr:hypothetical protein [Eubacterium sp.]
MIPKMLNVYKKLNIRYSSAILIYAIADIILYLINVFAIKYGGIILVLSTIITILALSLIIEIKVSYPQFFETFNIWLYIIIYCILPSVGAYFIEGNILTNVYADKFDVEGILSLFAKMILYFRAYVLTRKYDLDFM